MFFLFFIVFFLVTPLQACGNREFAVTCDSVESAVVPTIHVNSWGIASAGFRICWGENEWGEAEEAYVSIIDYRAPEKSQLLLSEGVSQEKAVFFRKMHLDEVTLAPTILEKSLACSFSALYSLPKVSGPIADDSELLALMISTPGLIWTGSGISLQSGIPTLPALYAELELVPIPYTHSVEEEGLRKMAANIKECKPILFNFLRRVFAAKKTGIQPSAAHCSIGEILKLLELNPGGRTHYITSNLDGIEEDLGYAETVAFEAGESCASAFLKTKSSKSESAVFVPHWILVIGLRVDDYGIIQWATEKAIPIYYVNPNAPEFSNFTSQPTAPPRLLEVRWIKRDAQEYMPELLKRLKERVNSRD